MPENNKEICKQIEFYFSDANIVRDQFLKTTIEAHNGVVPLEIINKFNRVKKHNKTVEELEEILKESKELQVVNKSIKRIKPIPSLEEHKAENRTFIVKPVPVELEVDDIFNLFGDLKTKIARVVRKKIRAEEKKTSVIVELYNDIDVELFSKLSILIDAPVSEVSETKEVPETKEEITTDKKEEIQPATETNKEIEEASNIEIENQVVKQPSETEPTKTEETKLEGTFSKRVSTESTEEVSVKKQKVQLRIIPLLEYLKEKKAKRQEKKEAKAQTTKERATLNLSQQFMNKLFKFTVIQTETKEPVSDQEIDALQIFDVKIALPETVSPAFIDIKNRHIRLKLPVEEIDPINLQKYTLIFTKLTMDEIYNYCKGLTFCRSKGVIKYVSGVTR
ncbi:lupus La protein [Nematocida sp. AWRm80]|nr:lupus La protein [Nematocida sp. AWRm80]